MIDYSIYDRIEVSKTNKDKFVTVKLMNQGMVEFTLHIWDFNYVSTIEQIKKLNYKYAFQDYDTDLEEDIHTHTDIFIR